MTGKLQNTRVYALELVLLSEVSHLSDHTVNDVVNTYFCARAGNISTANLLLDLFADTHPLCSLLSGPREPPAVYVVAHGDTERPLERETLPRYP